MLRVRVESGLVNGCREAARRIALELEEFSVQRTTVSIERTILRLFGLDGVDATGKPMPNAVVDRLVGRGLSDGICWNLGQLMAERNCSFEQAGNMLAEGFTPQPGDRDWRRPIDELAAQGRDRILRRKTERDQLLASHPPPSPPWLYCIVATGNIYEDVVQARAAAGQGAQIIAVIRSTAQSLLDYVPHGPTTEGFAGTFATQENFRIMREALDETSRELGRYVMLCNYCSGLCMPEIAAMGALERLDVMLNDALYGILFRNINMQRTLCDQFFSRRINGFSGIIISTGEDNYMKVDDGLAASHTVLASQFINEQLAVLSGVPEAQTGLGHAFELDPAIENGFLYELAHALLSREIFAGAPLKYMPPTRHKSGDIFTGHLQDGLFNLAALLSRQHIQLLGMLSEAVQTPGLHDRYLSLKNARYILSNLKDLPEELELSRDGIIQRRSEEVLRQAHALLLEISSSSLFDALEKGAIAGIERGREEGRGLEGLALRSENYYNPFENALRN